MSADTPIGPVVSSAHLAQSGFPALSEMEFALVTGIHAFHRWTTHCMAAAGAPGLSAMEVQVLHLVHHRGRAKTMAQLCLLLNVEDTHLVTYAARKLRDRGLVQDGRAGKEKTLSATEEGAALCARYGEVRKQILIDSLRAQGHSEEEVSRLAALLRALSGSYDQAARAAATL
ncbi:MAG: transcriptional regulator [Rhodobacterales bacterium]|nr:MAG: transcriptional regulator [Rhodobacterales bacterium]